MEGDGKARVISVADGVYIQGDETFWKKQGAPASVQKAGDKFIKAPASAASMTQSLSLKSFLQKAFGAVTPQPAGHRRRERDRRRRRLLGPHRQEGQGGGCALRLEGQVRGRALHRLRRPARASSTSPSGTRISASRRRPASQVSRSAEPPAPAVRGRAARPAARGRHASARDGIRPSVTVAVRSAGGAGEDSRDAGWRVGRGRRHRRADAVQQDGPATLAHPGLAGDLGGGDLGAGLGDGPRRRHGERADALAAPRARAGSAWCARRRGRARH